MSGKRYLMRSGSISRVHEGLDACSHFTCHASSVLYLSRLLIVVLLSDLSAETLLVRMAKRFLTRSSPGGSLASIRIATSATVLYALMIRKAATRWALLWFYAVFITGEAHTLVTNSNLLCITLDNSSLLLRLGLDTFGIRRLITLATSAAAFAALLVCSVKLSRWLSVTPRYFSDFSMVTS